MAIKHFVDSLACLLVKLLQEIYDVLMLGLVPDFLEFPSHLSVGMGLHLA